MSESAHPLAAEAIAALVAKGLTLATAEATTGGLIGHQLTGIAGSSSVFVMGVAPYWNEVKVRLGVPEAVLREHGAVSAEAAEALAIAVRNWSGADIGLAETGIAGPGGSEERPAGLFYIAIADGKNVASQRFEFKDDRAGNRAACAEAALRLLVAHVQASG
ncbi:MAG: CinA family protein [Chloroflexi bacterium]|nr:CinA family protein [Chloroflexota bacterium]